jgi:hypothetical protein
MDEMSCVLVSREEQQALVDYHGRRVKLLAFGGRERERLRAGPTRTASDP